jgi:hypothetical protein
MPPDVVEAGRRLRAFHRQVVSEREFRSVSVSAEALDFSKLR